MDKSTLTPEQLLKLIKETPKGKLIDVDFDNPIIVEGRDIVRYPIKFNTPNGIISRLRIRFANEELASSIKKSSKGYTTIQLCVYGDNSLGACAIALQERINTEVCAKINSRQPKSKKQISAGTSITQYETKDGEKLERPIIRFKVPCDASDPINKSKPVDECMITIPIDNLDSLSEVDGRLVCKSFTDEERKIKNISNTVFSGSVAFGILTVDNVYIFKNALNLSMTVRHLGLKLKHKNTSFDYYIDKDMIESLKTQTQLESQQQSQQEEEEENEFSKEIYDETDD